MGEGYRHYSDRQTFVKADDVKIVDNPRPTTRVLWDKFVNFDGFDKS